MYFPYGDNLPQSKLPPGFFGMQQSLRQRWVGNEGKYLVCVCVCVCVCQKCNHSSDILIEHLDDVALTNIIAPRTVPLTTNVYKHMTYFLTGTSCHG